MVKDCSSDSCYFGSIHTSIEVELFGLLDIIMLVRPNIVTSDLMSQQRNRKWLRTEMSSLFKCKMQNQWANILTNAENEDILFEHIVITVNGFIPPSQLIWHGISWGNLMCIQLMSLIWIEMKLNHLKIRDYEIAVYKINVIVWERMAEYDDGNIRNAKRQSNDGQNRKIKRSGWRKGQTCNIRITQS